MEIRTKESLLEDVDERLRHVARELDSIIQDMGNATEGKLASMTSTVRTQVELLTTMVRLTQLASINPPKESHAVHKD